MTRRPAVERLPEVKLGRHSCSRRFLEEKEFAFDTKQFSDIPVFLVVLCVLSAIVKTCVPHIEAGGHLAYIISPTHSVIDHVIDMLPACKECGLKVERRFIVTYQTQQATGQQAAWARDKKLFLKLYRDLIVLRLQ
jgi:hypothetical protein